jgi:hypothetical protein
MNQPNKSDNEYAIEVLEDKIKECKKRGLAKDWYAELQSAIDQLSEPKQSDIDIVVEELKKCMNLAGNKMYLMADEIEPFAKSLLSKLNPVPEDNPIEFNVKKGRMSRAIQEKIDCYDKEGNIIGKVEKPKFEPDTNPVPDKEQEIVDLKAKIGYQESLIKQLEQEIKKLEKKLWWVTEGWKEEANRELDNKGEK